MKKLFFIALAVLLVAIIVVTCVFVPKNMTISDVVASDGTVVYLTVSLKKPVNANSMAISYAFDASVLEPVKEENQWIPQGSLQDFSEFGAHGVWCSKEEIDLSGDICTLAFRVLPNAEYKRSAVRCSLVLQNMDSEKKYTASAKITPACKHKYSSWVDTEQGEHTRTCSLCDAVQLQAHTWDSGKSSVSIANPEMMLYTCTTCGCQQMAPADTLLQNNVQDSLETGLNQMGQWGSFFEDNTTEAPQTPSSGNQTASGNQVPWGNHFTEDNQKGNNPNENNYWGNAFGEKTPEESPEFAQSGTSVNNPWMEGYHLPDQETTSPTGESLQNQKPSWMEHLDTSIFQDTTAPTEEHSEEDHTHGNTAPAVDPHENHDHTQVRQEIDPLTVCVLLGVVIIGGVSMLYFLKRKKHR